MKKIFVMAAMLAVAATASAQVYVEGALGYGTSSNKPDEGDKRTTSQITVTPAVGYYLNDKLDIGLSASFTSVTQKQDNAGEAVTSNWSVAPFVRYSFLQLGKFEALARLAVDFGGGKSKTTPDGSESVDSGKYSTMGINLMPVLAYNVNENIVLTASINIFNLGFNQTKWKDEGAKRTDSSFGIGVNSLPGSIRPEGGLQIGFAYKF